jgi:hypothetical protein
MANLVPSVVPLDKGLNLQTAKLVAPPGSILDTLNYEQVDFQGQKRIDGFVRYDGSTSSALNDYYKITLTSTFTGATGDLVSNGDALFGMVTGVDTTIVYVAPIDFNVVPVTNDTLNLLVAGIVTTSFTVSACIAGIDSGITEEQHYQNLLTFSGNIRSKVEALPGNIIGLHWFKDRLYAVANVVTMSLDTTSPSVKPNDTIIVNGNSAKVLECLTLPNTRFIFLDSMDQSLWTTAGDEAFVGALSVGFISDGIEAITYAQEIASFYESRNEAQVLEEDGPSGPYDFGWRFVDLGWLINFDNGLSLYGSLPSLNQNITGLGVQGPSSIAGDDGRPLLLSQKVHLTSGTAQVNGWKDSATPTSYSIDASTVTDVDSVTVYADAYISWDGTTGEVVGDTATLTEYPATNTVTVDIP